MFPPTGRLPLNSPSTITRGPTGNSSSASTAKKPSRSPSKIRSGRTFGSTSQNTLVRPLRSNWRIAPLAGLPKAVTGAESSWCQSEVKARPAASGPAQMLAADAVTPDLGHVSDAVALKLHRVDVVSRDGFCPDHQNRFALRTSRLRDSALGSRSSLCRFCRLQRRVSLDRICWSVQFHSEIGIISA